MTREDLVKCREMLNKLDVLCKEYFKATSPDWCFYSSWSFSHEHEDCIIIHYSYSIERGKWEGSHAYVKFNDLINYDYEQF